MTIPAYVLVDLAEEYPDTVDVLYQTALSLPDFRWKGDGEDLLRRHKPDDFRHADLPAISLMPAALQDARRTGASR